MNTKKFEMRAMGLVLGVLLASVTLAGSLQGGPGGEGSGRQGRQGGPGMGQRGGMRGGPQSIAMIAARPDVAQEINLTEEQGEQLRTLLESSRPQRGQGGPGRQGGQGQNGQRPDPETMRKEMQARMDEQDRKAAQILSATQYRRVEELSIQMRGLSAALDPKVQAKLGLSADQKAALDKLAKSQGGPGMGGPGMGGPGGRRGPGGPGQDGPGQDGPGQDGRGPGGQGGPPPPDGGQGGPPPPGDEGQGGGGQRRRPGMGGQRGPGGGQMEAKIAEILTDAQKAKLKTLGGAEFKFQRGPGGPGGQGGPDGQRGPGGPDGPGGQGGPPPREDGPGPDLELMSAVLDGS